MGLLDVLRGRTRQVPPNLDAIFALPSAAITLQSACGLEPSGQGAICFKAGTGPDQLEAGTEIDELLNDADPKSIRRVDDDLGFTWLVIDDPDVGSLVTRLHGANTSLEEHGLGPHLLCAVVGLHDAAGGPGNLAPCYLVYLFKRGTFYPFAPRDGERRDNALELHLRAELADDLPFEKDLSRWMALWGLPVS